jgi:rubrerythrin
MYTYNDAESMWANSSVKQRRSTLKELGISLKYVNYTFRNLPLEVKSTILNWINPQQNPERPPKEWWNRIWEQIAYQYPRQRGETVREYEHFISQVTAGIWYHRYKETRNRLIQRYEVERRQKISRPKWTCPACDKPVSERDNDCPYCGLAFEIIRRKNPITPNPTARMTRKKKREIERIRKQFLFHQELGIGRIPPPSATVTVVQAKKRRRKKKGDDTEALMDKIDWQIEELKNPRKTPVRIMKIFTKKLVTSGKPDEAQELLFPKKYPPMRTPVPKSRTTLKPVCWECGYVLEEPGKCPRCGRMNYPSQPVIRPSSTTEVIVCPLCGREVIVPLGGSVVCSCGTYLKRTTTPKEEIGGIIKRLEEIEKSKNPTAERILERYPIDVRMRIRMTEAILTEKAGGRPVYYDTTYCEVPQDTPLPDIRLTTKEKNEIVAAVKSHTFSDREIEAGIDKWWPNYWIRWLLEKERNPLAYSDYTEALEGEGWAIGDYKDMISKADKPYEIEKIRHIMKEEQEHQDELLGLMNKEKNPLTPQEMEELASIRDSYLEEMADIDPFEDPRRAAYLKGKAEALTNVLLTYDGQRQTQKEMGKNIPINKNPRRQQFGHITVITCPKCGNKKEVQMPWTTFYCYKCGFVIDKPTTRTDKGSGFIPGTRPKGPDKEGNPTPERDLAKYPEGIQERIRILEAILTQRAGGVSFFHDTTLPPVKRDVPLPDIKLTAKEKKDIIEAAKKGEFSSLEKEARDYFSIKSAKDYIRQFPDIIRLLEQGKSVEEISSELILIPEFVKNVHDTWIRVMRREMKNPRPKRNPPELKFRKGVAHCVDCVAYDPLGGICIDTGKPVLPLGAGCEHLRIIPQLIVHCEKCKRRYLVPKRITEGTIRCDCGQLVPVKRNVEKNPLTQKEVDTAAKAFETFHAFPPQVAQEIKPPELSGALVKIGTLPEIPYFSNKWKNQRKLKQKYHGKKGQMYSHELDKPGIVAFKPDKNDPEKGTIIAWAKARVKKEGIVG